MKKILIFLLCAFAVLPSGYALADGFSYTHVNDGSDSHGGRDLYQPVSGGSGTIGEAYSFVCTGTPLQYQTNWDNNTSQQGSDFVPKGVSNTYYTVLNSNWSIGNDTNFGDTAGSAGGSTDPYPYVACGSPVTFTPYTPPAPVISYPDGSEVFPGVATSSSTTISFEIVDNPTEDLFDGVILFVIGMIFMVWIFRKQK